MLDLRTQYLSIKDEIDKAILDILEFGIFILGENVKMFENEFAKYCGVKHGIGVASGTDALKIALLACGIKLGDEVITTPLSAIATAFAITYTGARPVFVDIDESFNIDVNKIEDSITKKTKAIIPVHLYGNPVAIDIILEIAKKHDLKIIEDCAQAHGAEYNGKKVGCFGDVGAFSFYPTKNLGCYGDGGMVVTNDKEISEKVFLLRNYGQKKRFEHLIKGFSSRLDELQAAILRVKLKHLDKWNDSRIKNAEIYNERLKEIGIDVPIQIRNAKHVYHQYVIRTDKRDGLREFLKSKGVSSDIHYPIPIHLQKVYSDANFTLPIVKRMVKEIISLPIFPELTTQDIEKICGVIKTFENEKCVRSSTDANSL